jgi:uroporphyrinogen III methyltransferase/synthase
MGAENLTAIVAELLTEGWAPETPAAVISWGTTPQQKTITGHLCDITQRSEGLQSPAVLVVGQVVALRKRLNWFERRPLAGKQIVITRAREQAGELAALLAEQGAVPIEFPTIAIRPTNETALLDAALQKTYDWIIFTSVNGVRAAWSQLRERGRDARAFGWAQLCAIGPATAAALAGHGLHADFVPDEFVAEAIVAGLGPVAGQRILLLRADIARPVLADGLRCLGAHVDEVTAYHTVLAGPDDPQAREIAARLAAGQIDAIAFTSSSTVRGFVAALDLGADAGHPMAVWPCVACIGPITARTAREKDLPVDVVARTYTIPGLVTALTAHFSKNTEGG